MPPASEGVSTPASGAAEMPQRRSSNSVYAAVDLLLSLNGGGNPTASAGDTSSNKINGTDSMNNMKSNINDNKNNNPVISSPSIVNNLVVFNNNYTHTNSNSTNNSAQKNPESTTSTPEQPTPIMMYSPKPMHTSHPHGQNIVVPVTDPYHASQQVLRLHPHQFPNFMQYHPQMLTAPDGRSQMAPPQYLMPQPTMGYPHPMAYQSVMKTAYSNMKHEQMDGGVKPPNHQQVAQIRKHSSTSSSNSVGTTNTTTHNTMSPASRSQHTNRSTKSGTIDSDPKYADLLDMSTTEFNRYLKMCGLDAEQILELRKARRRKKNRLYAKRSRGKKLQKLLEMNVKCNLLQAKVSHLTKSEVSHG